MIKRKLQRNRFIICEKIENASAEYIDDQKLIEEGFKTVLI